MYKYITLSNPGYMKPQHSSWHFPLDSRKNYKLEWSSDRLTGTTKLTLSPGLQNKETFKCINDSFPGTLTYLLFLKNCLNFTPNVKFFFNPGDKVIFSAEISCNLDLRVWHMVRNHPDGYPYLNLRFCVENIQNHNFFW